MGVERAVVKAGSPYILAARWATPARWAKAAGATAVPR